MSVPALRLRLLNDRPQRSEGRYVLYWMTAFRRSRYNFALQRAVELAREHECGLVVLEPLRVGYPWACDRFHRFVIDGMRDNRRAFEDTDVRYVPYVEPEEGAGKGLLEALAAEARAVVTDDYPCFFLPRMQRAAAKKLDVALEAVDSNGLFPLRGASKSFARAYDFRRHLQKALKPHLSETPKLNPLARIELAPVRALPKGVSKRWPAASDALLEGERSLADFPIDHDVPPVDTTGGSAAAQRRLRSFLKEELEAYGEERSQPGRGSGLSPYLHFGHLSVHQVLNELGRQEDWSPDDLPDKGNGSREGWWGMSSAAEGFLDELVTWRELGYQFTWRRDDYRRYDALPDWARETLAEHSRDERKHTYTLEQLERAETHDDIWNAAQRQLLGDGIIENYLRMLWGKNVLAWTERPQEAFERLVELNNKYALDGRDPNSYSGIGWVFGRFDRPWGPEREVFGKVRYMTSDSTRRKLRLGDYLEKWSDQPSLFS